MNHSLLTHAASPALDKLLTYVKEKKTAALTGLPDSMTAFIAAKIAAETGKRVLMISGNDLKATHDAEDAQQLLGTQAVCLPGGEIDLTRGASSHESAWRRLEALSRASEGEVRLMCASVDAVMQRMGEPDIFRRSIIRLAAGDEFPPEKLIRALTRMGYERVDMVEGKGQCAMRGAIVDVYPPAGAQSLRIEFFDDEVDSIRTFDCISQRSSDHLDSCVLAPATEVLLAEEQCASAAARMRRAIEKNKQAAAGETLLFEGLPPLPDDEELLAEMFDKKISPKLKEKERSAARTAELERRMAQLMTDADTVESGLPFRRIRAWLPVLCEKTATILDWYRPEIIVLSQPDHLRERTVERLNNFQEDLQGAMERGEAVQEQENLLLGWEELLTHFAGRAVIASAEMLRGMGGLNPVDAIDLQVRGVAGYSSQVKLLAEDCAEWLREGWRVAILSGGVARGKRLAQSLEEMEVSARFTEDDLPLKAASITVLPATLSHGFLWEAAKLAVISDTDVYGAGYRKAKSRRNAGERVAAFTDLNVGDYVVHEDYGVGVYQGTVQMTTGGTRRDYLLIAYMGKDKLYVPVEQFSRVQKYIGNPSNPPKLNNLGGGEWQRQKKKVKEGLKKLAFDLVALYAKRSQATGYAFSPDTPWQRQFEDMFPYELTPDQEQSVAEITADMESARNMDRLLCGDVGYGKTEVSLRAAFKAVMDSKQVAILAPTTILAQQHYNTVVKRFQGFPVKIEMISRFKTAKETKEITARLREGDVDILIGTHAILAKSVKFKNLGLLIVDEEQRFGVAHKEVIKNMKSQVDVLTLSATPIPRTLHMSMVGIRDMSVLETPPEERLPVQTRVVEYSDGLVRDAILREISRGGQVYFLYNSVRTIDEFYARLHALVPEARIGVAHGQMREHGLEDVMMDFYAGSYDVLLCTTIIESGLDVPTANTLIVFDADRFGLSQLYQIRGRVGRSNRQAYAYFTVRPDKMLSETAEQRLSAIREFTEFGAGFRIPMRDLEIRGAGNILGPEQSGHLATVGYDMYCKLIEETLAEARHEMQGLPVKEENLETRVDIRVDAYLPNDYVKSDRQRMEMYKRIASLSSDSDRSDITDELVDRFGDVPQVVETLLDIAQIRALANRIGVSQLLYKKGGFLVLKLSEKHVADQMLLLQAMHETDKRLMPATTGEAAIVFVDVRLNEYGMIREGIAVLKKLIAKMDELEAKKKLEQA